MPTPDKPSTIQRLVGTGPGSLESAAIDALVDRLEAGHVPPDPRVAPAPKARPVTPSTAAGGGEG